MKRFFILSQIIKGSFTISIYTCLVLRWKAQRHVPWGYPRWGAVGVRDDRATDVFIFSALPRDESVIYILALLPLCIHLHYSFKNTIQHIFICFDSSLTLLARLIDKWLFKRLQSNEALRCLMHVLAPSKKQIQTEPLLLCWSKEEQVYLEHSYHGDTISTVRTSAGLWVAILIYMYLQGTAECNFVTTICHDVKLPDQVSVQLNIKCMSVSLSA